MLQNFEAYMMLGEEERGVVIERGFGRNRYVDPVLEGDEVQNHQFASDLAQRRSKWPCSWSPRRLENSVSS